MESREFTIGKKSVKDARGNMLMITRSTIVKFVGLGYLRKESR